VKRSILLIMGLTCSLGCAARAYRPPAFRAIELRGATLIEERADRRISRCEIINWIHDAERKLWIGVCR
jgi:hypothetical protein